MAEAPAAPVKRSAAEMRRQANIQRFGYDPNEVVERTPTDNAGFEAYLEQVNPGMKRIAEADRPNLMMGDMYGMMPKGSEVVGSKGDVTFHRSPDGEYYATAFNPDVNEEDVIGYITDRGDGTELAVVGEMQGQGVGGELQYLFRSENPNAPTGGLTEAGEGSLRRTYDRLADEGIVDGDVPFGGASAPQPDLDTRIPYRRDGAAIADRLQQTPSAKTALGIDDVAPAGMFTTVKAQQPNILREHTSEGFLSDELVPPKLTSIGDYLGRDSMAIVGDNTGRQTVTGQGGRMFETPVDSMAGFQYIDVPGQGYAGARSATSSKYQEALRSNDPFYNSLLMGERSGDFSQHVNDIYGEMFKNSSIDPSDISKIDDSIRKIGLSKIVKVLDDDGNVVKKADGSPKTKSITTYPFEGFSSVKDPKAVGNYLKDLPTGTQRAAFIKGMDKAGLHKMGVPKVADARLAAADPEQIGMDWGTVGYRMFTPDLGKGLTDTTPQMSTTYDTGIDKIGGSETLLGDGSRGIPANLLYRDLAESQRAKGTGGGILMTSPDYKIYEASPKRAKQLIDNLAVETVDTFLELERRFGREQAIKYASDVVSGGKLTSDVIKAARKANAPTWMIGALTTAAGLSSTESEQGEGA